MGANKKSESYLLNTKTDIELLKIIHEEFDQYFPEMIEQAKSVLTKRGISPDSKDLLHSLEAEIEADVKDTILFGTAWMKFYIYFRLPFGIVVGSVESYSSLAFILSEGKKYYSGMSIPVIFGLAIIVVTLLSTIIVMIGLFERKQWGIKLNEYLLFWEALIYSLILLKEVETQRITYFLAGFIFFLLIWTVPNTIYFRKRAYLFNGETNGAGRDGPLPKSVKDEK